MKYLLWLCALLCAGAAAAQSRHYVDLSGQTLATPLKAGRITEVFDARPDRTSIGWVFVGLANERAPADLTGGLTPALRQLLAAPNNEASPAYALRVHRLAITEGATTTSEVASAELIVDLLRARADGQYELLWRVGESVETRGLEVTGKHPGNIAAVVQSCLARFEVAAPASLPVAAVLTAEQAAAPVTPLVPLTPYPVLAGAARRPGVYHSLDELRRNEPSGQKLVAISKTPRTSAEWQGTDDIDLFYVDERGARTPVRNVWGYCDGQDLYILLQRRYYLLTPTAEGFSFDAPSAADPNAVTTGAVLGGAIGAGIAAAASGGHRQEHRLNLLTGRITAMPLKAAKADFEDADVPEGKVVVFRRRPSPGAVDVYVGKNVVGGLNAETGSVTVPWTDRRNALRLCARYETLPEACLDVLPRPGETLYVEWVDGPGDPQLKLVPAKEGVFETRRAELRARQKKG